MIGRGLALYLTLPAAMLLVYRFRLMTLNIKLSVVNFLNPIIFLKQIFMGQYNNNMLREYFITSSWVYLIFSVIFIWIYGWGFEKNFEIVQWKIFLGIESDPNYSSAAILMITLTLFQLKKIKMSYVILINSIFFILLFSRTAFFTLIITFLFYSVLMKLRTKTLRVVFYFFIIVIVSLPLLLRLLNNDVLFELNILTSGRVGYWYYLITDDPKFGSISYYESKQAHNGLFQLHRYYGWIWGSVAYATIHLLFVQNATKSMLCTMIFPLLFIEMFLNSYSATYFLIFLAAFFSIGRERLYGINFDVKT